MGVVGDIVDFNPYNIPQGNYPLLEVVDSYLIEYDSKLQPRPAAVASWEFAGDHRSMVLHLRHGIKFQTGKEFTSADVIEGFKVARNPTTGLDKNFSMSIVRSVSAADRYTVNIDFVRETPEPVATDMLQGFPIVDSRYNNEKDLLKAPASAGPFKLLARTPDVSVTLGRFEDYWVPKQPYLDKFVISVFKEDPAMVAALQSGAIDGAMYILAEDAKELRQSFDIVQGAAGSLTTAIRMSAKTPPFDNVKMRQAIQRCVDRQRAVEVAQAGYGSAAVLPWGPSSLAYDASYNKKYEFDLEAAKALWEAAGRPKGGTAISGGSSDQKNADVLLILQADLEKIGFKLEIEELDLATLSARNLAGEYGLEVTQSTDCNLYPSSFQISTCWRSSDNPLWDGGVPPKLYTDAIDAVLTAMTPSAQKSACAQLNAALTDLAWVVPVFVAPTLYAVKKGVRGVTTDINGYIELNQAVVS